tara:strand:+ start:21409 stop:21603 length:195 start_codon:yes stop_codon:yes gene_type:complete
MNSPWLIRWFVGMSVISAEQRVVKLIQALRRSLHRVHIPDADADVNGGLDYGITTATPPSHFSC